MSQNHFVWNSLMHDTCTEVNNVPLDTPCEVADLVGIPDSPFTLGEDDADQQCLLCSSAVELTLTGYGPFTAEFFGAAPKPPHK